VHHRLSKTDYLIVILLITDACATIGVFIAEIIILPVGLHFGPFHARSVEICGLFEKSDSVFFVSS